MERTPYLPHVREQYENFPYPLRNPDDEKKRLYPTTIDCLDCINYYCFSGKRDFTKDFRALIAGGGTGDAAIFLAEQLRDTNAEIVYLDISAASMEIAKQRAAVRHLSSIKWVQASCLIFPTWISAFSTISTVPGYFIISPIPMLDLQFYRML